MKHHASDNVLGVPLLVIVLTITTRERLLCSLSFLNSIIPFTQRPLNFLHQPQQPLCFRCFTLFFPLFLPVQYRPFVLFTPRTFLAPRWNDGSIGGVGDF